MNRPAGVGLLAAAILAALAAHSCAASPEDYFAQGNEYFEKKDYDKAIAAYSEVIRLKPDYAPAYTNRGAAYERKGDCDRAIKDHDMAIRLKPNFALAYTNRGVAYAKKELSDKAIRDHDTAIRLKPDLACAYNNRAAEYWAKGDFDRALADYSTAIRVQPLYALAYRGRGEVHIDLHKYDEALRDLAEAIKLTPNDHLAHCLRGRAYDEKGDYGAAIRDYRRAIHLKADYAEALNALAWIYATHKYANVRSGEAALRLARRAVALKRSAARLDTLACAYAERGDFTKAIETQQQAIALCKDPAHRQELERRREGFRKHKTYVQQQREEEPGDKRPGGE